MAEETAGSSHQMPPDADRAGGVGGQGLAGASADRQALRLTGAAQAEHPEQGRHPGGGSFQPEGRGFVQVVVDAGKGGRKARGLLPAEPAQLGAGARPLPEGGVRPGGEDARPKVEELLGPMGPPVRGADDVRPHQQPRLEKDQPSLLRRAGPEHRSCVHTRSPLSVSHSRTKRPQGRASSRQTASAVPAITAQRTNTAPQPKPSAAAPMPQVAMAAPR